jgi:hypothetical protein
MRRSVRSVIEAALREHEVTMRICPRKHRPSADDGRTWEPWCRVCGPLDECNEDVERVRLSTAEHRDNLYGALFAASVAIKSDGPVLWH